MSSTPRAVVCALVASVFAACSTSYGTAPDAPADAGTSDASASSDAPPAPHDASDAGDASDACVPAPATCSGAVTHSLDFASPVLPPAPFTTATENATVTHVAGGRCGAGAMHVEANVPGGEGASAQGVIARTLNGSFSRVHVAFAFRGPQPTVDGYAIFGCNVSLVADEPSTARTSIFVDINGAEISMRGNVRDAAGANVPAFEAVTLDAFLGDAEAATWRTFDARLTLGASTVRVDATFDGVAQPAEEAPLAAAVARINIDCGIPYADQAGTYSVDLDDILFEACP